MALFLGQVKNGEEDFGWGMVVNFQKKANQSDVSRNCSKDSSEMFKV